MPKRKHKSDDDELEFLSWKLRKLERKIRHRSRSRSKERRRRDRSQPSSRYPRERERDASRSVSRRRHLDKTVEELLDNLHEPAPTVNAPESTEAEQAEKRSSDNFANNDAVTASLLAAPTEAEPPNETTSNDVIMATEEIDNNLLEILGADLTTGIKYGKDIHNELASRLQHIATTGLTKENRKELIEKYLVPANCVKVGAPTMNLEIKAAVSEIVLKRDKGIEARQKQLASAIAGLAELLNNELERKERDSTLLKQLMDICRILCDIQHGESVTRRNFAIFSLKKELIEHLASTKIDQCLFGEHLAETLKSAKAITKSGSELKTKQPPKPKLTTTSACNLNWKSPPPARKHQSGPRGREAAPPLLAAPGPAARPPRNVTHGSSFKTSQYQSKKPRRH